MEKIMDIKYSAVKAPMRGRVHHPVRLGRILVYGVMFLLLTVSLIPLVWVVRTAFIPRELTLDLTAVAWPTLENFRRVLAAAPFGKYDLYCGGSAGDPVRTDYIGGLCFCENRFLRLQSIIRIVPFTADDRTGSTDPAQLFHDGKMGTDGHEDRHYAPFFCFGHGNSDRATDHQDDPL